MKFIVFNIKIVSMEFILIALLKGLLNCMLHISILEYYVVVIWDPFTASSKNQIIKVLGTYTFLSFAVRMLHVVPMIIIRYLKCYTMLYFNIK